MNRENTVAFIISVGVIVAIIYIGIHFVANYLTGNINPVSGKNLKGAYSQVVSKETDANKLASNGSALVKGNQLENGIINLQRAVTLEPNYRDAWVWLGYAEIKNNQPQEAIESLQKAENIDPTYPDTFKYLAIAYTQTGDTNSAKTAQEKYDYLSKQK